MAQFKEQFGLDYLKGSEGLKKGQSAGEVPPLPPGMDDALIAYGGKVLDLLANGPQKTFDLARQLKRRVDELSPVVNYFESKGYLERTVRDSLGDDTLQLTNEGRKKLVG